MHHYLNYYGTTEIATGTKMSPQYLFIKMKKEPTRRHSENSSEICGFGNNIPIEYHNV